MLTFGIRHCEGSERYINTPLAAPTSSNNSALSSYTLDIGFVKKEEKKKMSKHGFTAVPRDFSVVLKGQRYLHEPAPLMVSDIHIPDTPLAKRVLEYAKAELREETFNQYVSRYIPGQTETDEAD